MKFQIDFPVLIMASQENNTVMFELYNEVHQLLWDFETKKRIAKILTKIENAIKTKYKKEINDITLFIEAYKNKLQLTARIELSYFPPEKLIENIKEDIKICLLSHLE